MKQTHNTMLPDWRNFNPDQLEQLLPTTGDSIQLAAIENAAFRGAAGLERVLADWEGMEALGSHGISTARWRDFLDALATARRERAQLRCYVMLDFDGVLHSLGATGNAQFIYLPTLETVLRDYLSVEVVVTSSWRHTHELAKLQALFSADIRDRIVGVTPDIPSPPSTSDAGLREREVTAWLHAYGELGVPWVAVDDDAHLYESGSPIIVVSDHFGMTEADALRDALDDPGEFARHRRRETGAALHGHGTPPTDSVLQTANYRRCCGFRDERDHDLVVIKEGVRRYRLALSQMTKARLFHEWLAAQERVVAQQRCDEPPWRDLDPDRLERAVRQKDGFVAFEELERAEISAPRLGAAFHGWGRGLTVTDAGVPAGDWIAFLEWLRRNRKRNS